MKFRKKPVVIEAMKIPPSNDTDMVAWGRFAAWLSGHSRDWVVTGHDDGIDLPTLEGLMHGKPGDWVIVGVAGEVYPCKPDIFAATYEPAE